MSFGFAPGDIIAAVTLVAQIYEKCFTKAQAAGECAGGKERQAFSLSTRTPR